MNNVRIYIVVEMDSLNKTFDYYSIQDGNRMIVEWEEINWSRQRQKEKMNKKL